MALVKVGTQRAYEFIREKIVTLELAPGMVINEQGLAAELEMNLAPVREALKLLAHDGLVVITPRHGLHVADVNLPDLEQISEMRLELEGLCARLAAERATADDLAVMDALRDEQAAVPAGDARRQFDLDHKFHQAVAAAAQNIYLAETLERYFGLSQRLWYLALPQLGSLTGNVQQHLDLVEAIRARDAGRAEQIMRHHVQVFYNRVRDILLEQKDQENAIMASVTVVYGDEIKSVEAAQGSLLGDAVVATGLPLEQPCAGRGTCGKCKALAEGELNSPDEAELKQLTSAELAAGYRLACRAQVQGEVSVTLAPIVVYSNKVFRVACKGHDDFQRDDAQLGLAIDLGSTTVAAFLTMLDTGRVCAGAAALNQQTVYGADVISRLAAADQSQANTERLSALAMASIVQAIDALKLSRRVKRRIRTVTIVGNCAMHHLLLRYPVDTLAVIPFQPYKKAAVRSANTMLRKVLPPEAEVNIPPLIGGFVGSDALACLTYFGFDRASDPMAAIDLGTNGEVMVTDGERILVASTAAGPAFEGVNISCGSRAVDGAIVEVKVNQDDGSFAFSTIADAPPVGLTGSGLLSLISELRRAGVIQASGRMVSYHPIFGGRISTGKDRVRRIALTNHEAGGTIYLTQRDVRELQKAKAAVAAATEILMARLGLQAGDLQRMFLTGSFGSQLNVEAIVSLGMIPPVELDIVETPANGAGLGAALMLDDEEFARAERIATQAEQVDLDLDTDFNARYIELLAMPERP